MIHVIEVESANVEIRIDTDNQLIELIGVGPIHPRKILSALEKEWKEAGLASKRFPDFIVLNHSENNASENIYRIEEWTIVGKDLIFGRELLPGQTLSDIFPNYA